MSIMNDVTVTCPSCEAQITVTAVESVNADRRPDLRDEIIAGTFQVQQCSDCEAEFLLDPQFNYLDMGRGQWFSIQPLGLLGDWMALEDEAISTFDLAYGEQASPQAREIGDSLSPRLVFGWAALREKLLIGEAGLDDATVELTKLAMIRGLPGAPLRAGTEMRLLNVSPETGDMVFEWQDNLTGETVETLIAPRSLYDSILEAPEAWAQMRGVLEDRVFCDVQKLYIGEGRAAG